jgi:hypothetical protein
MQSGMGGGILARVCMHQNPAGSGVVQLAAGELAAFPQRLQARVVQFQRLAQFWVRTGKAGNLIQGVYREGCQVACLTLIKWPPKLWCRRFAQPKGSALGEVWLALGLLPRFIIAPVLQLLAELVV